jgi:hypothetical protein
MCEHQCCLNLQVNTPYIILENTFYIYRYPPEFARVTTRSKKDYQKGGMLFFFVYFLNIRTCNICNICGEAKVYMYMRIYVCMFYVCIYMYIYMYICI